MVENLMGTVGLAFQPQFGYFRRVVSKVFAMITRIDDMYDVHGSLEELKLFTEVVNRWDVNAMDELPDYMKICFLALNNFVNEWVDLCKSDLVEEDSIRFEEYYNVIRYVSTILRLLNDLGTAKLEKVTGDIPKSVECYMNEIGASEAKAHRHINSLICETWKNLNKEVSNSSYSKSFMEVAVNLVRMCLRMYQHGDGHIVQYDETKKRIISLFFQPIA
ncbi:myrcene synthase, chloroplastic-like [Neltuma alba]|nr:myrcene synthase, chloroplastic-like [Prosopis alba]